MTVNEINGKKYIGKHASTLYDTSYLGSGKILQEAITKYGKENFCVYVIKECESLDELNRCEKDTIERLDAVNSREFYNVKSGGDGGCSTGTHWIHKGDTFKIVPQEDIEKFLSNGYELGGPKQSSDTKEERASSNRGKKHPGAGHKISSALMGRKLSEEHKEKLRNAKVGKPSPRRVSIMCVETGEIYGSLKEATEKMGMKSSGNLCSCLKGKRETAFGLHWKYI